MFKLSSVIVVGMLFFAACTANIEMDRSSLADEKINRLYQRFSEAYDSLDVDKVSKLYAENAFYLTPYPKAPVLEGRSSIRESFAGFMEGAAEQNRNIDIAFRILERTIADSLAFDVGYYRTRSKPDSVAHFAEGGGVGKFVTVIGLLPSGEWKFLLDGYNPAPYEAFLTADSVGFNPAYQ